MSHPTLIAAIRPVTDAKPALIPVAPLSKRARSIFDLTVSGHPHLRPCDATLLTLYARCAARVLAGRGDSRQREKQARLLLAYGRALRLHGGVYVPKKHRRADAVAP